MFIAAIVLCALMAPLIVLTLVFDVREKHLLKTVVKGAASCLFVIAGGLCFALSSGGTANVLMLLALVFCMVGDVLLAIKSEKEGLTLAVQGGGMFSFIGAHVLFVAAFFIMTSTAVAFHFNLYLIIPLLALPILVLIAFAAGFFSADKPVMRIGAIVYSIVIAFTITAAANLRAYEANTFTNLVIAGAVLFTISDLLLACMNYSEQLKPARKILFPLVLVVYYAGQALLAISLAYN